VRVTFDRNEKRPGFFQIDTVSHCGARASGQFCQTLTVTDVGSGWTEVCALLYNAHRWVKEHISLTQENLPFPMLGIESDNGGEFINHQLLDFGNYAGVLRNTFGNSAPIHGNNSENFAGKRADPMGSW
jgi:hypothetical protein